MFEANCSRQVGQHKKKNLSPNVFVFTRVVTKVRVSDADRKDTKPSAFWSVSGNLFQKVGPREGALKVDSHVR